MFSVLVLSAGFGTRLRPLTDELPKPLVPVGDRPLLVSILENLLEGKAANVVVNSHHRADEILKLVKSLRGEVHVSHELEILGTAGGIAAARPLLGSLPLLVVNGDIWGELPVERIWSAAGPGLTLVVTPSAHGAGTVGIGVHGEVVRLRGEVFGREVRAADYRGVCTLQPDLVLRVPDRGCLIGDVALPLLRAGGRIDTCELTTPFWDVGSIEGYLAANSAWLRARGSESFLGPLSVVGAGVRVRQSVIGAGAVVLGEGLVDNTVLWPGARATAPLSNVVVTTTGLVVRAVPA